MDEETRNRIFDYFSGSELVEYLRLDTFDVIDAFEDEIMEVIFDLEELMGVKNGK